MRLHHLITLVAFFLLGCEVLQAQPFRRGRGEFNAKRTVTLPSDMISSVAVAEFLHHGQINPDGKNVAVLKDRGRKLLPLRILQLGPGDFCRLAFQTVKGQTNYKIFYGGSPPDEAVVPKWTNEDGILLETREYRWCNTNDLESVRNAFSFANTIGTDYVPSVAHSANPFDLSPRPFMSRYSGLLRIDKSGRYGFITSSRDCSFLLINDRMVVAAPGIHRPIRQARPDLRKDIDLSAGAHKFEYYHVATGSKTMAFIAWKISPAKAKPEKMVPIPPEVFHANMIVRTTPGPVTMRTMKLTPDFAFEIAGDVPLPDLAKSLVRVTFKNRSPTGLLFKAKLRWDFGDGQTSTDINPTHVYLHPDIYNVKLAISRGSRTVSMVNRIYVDRPAVTRRDRKSVDTLDDYLPLLETYNTQTLDADSLCQLVLFYRWKCDLLLSIQPDENKRPAQNHKKVRSRPIAERTKETSLSELEAKSFIQKAVDAGKVAFIGKSTATGDKPLYMLATLIGPMARNTLGESELALQIWQGAALKISDPELKANCQTKAADIALNDLLKPSMAKSLLDSAGTFLGQKKTGRSVSRFQRVLGDFYAAADNRKNATAAYKLAEEKLENALSKVALRGAHSRSAEWLIQLGKWDRAAAELQHWEEQFPTDKLEGLLSLTYAKYWAKRGQYDQAIAQAKRLQTINPESPYTDQIFFVAAMCEAKQGKKDQALASLYFIIENHPGSPLIAEVKRHLKELGAGELD